jgi:hypothetical protein
MANHTGVTQPTPAPVTPNASLTTAQKNALNALQTARAAYEAAGVAVFIGEVNTLLAAVDATLAAMV